MYRAELAQASPSLKVDDSLFSSEPEMNLWNIIFMNSGRIARTHKFTRSYLTKYLVYAECEQARYYAAFLGRTTYTHMYVVLDACPATKGFFGFRCVSE